MRIGWIDYTNTIPFRDAIKDKNGKVIIEGTPSVLNKLLRIGKIDIGIVSSAEYMENFSEYLILPNLSISSYGKVNSVVLLSNFSIDSIDTVVLSEESKTSNYLVKIIYKEFWRRDADFVSKHKKTTYKSKRTGFVFIGDRALLNKNRFRFSLDLSEIWYRYTKLPFVFALWCVREDFLHNSKEEVLKLYEKLVLSVKTYNKSKLPQEVKAYLENLDFSLKEEHIESLRRFSYYLLKHSIISKSVEFRFLNL